MNPTVYCIVSRRAPTVPRSLGAEIAWVERGDAEEKLVMFCERYGHYQKDFTVMPFTIGEVQR